MSEPYSMHGVNDKCVQTSAGKLGVKKLQLDQKHVFCPEEKMMMMMMMMSSKRRAHL